MARLSRVETAIDAGAGESAQVIFRLRGGVKTPLAGEFEIVSIGKIDVTFPLPRVSISIFSKYSDKSLVAVRVGDSVAAAVLIAGFHVRHCSVWRAR
jgi:hypothetical protein